MKLPGVVTAGFLALAGAVVLGPGGPVPVLAQEAAVTPSTPTTEGDPAAAPEVPATCAKAEFESAVDHAAESLRDLNNKNRPDFQAKLRQLKEKRGWNDNQFMKEAAPFVKDDKISEYDTKTNELLASISSMGQEGANASEPNCTVLAELRGLMQVLIETQASKWSYMFQKLDAEIAR